jgi:hypothetical protein
MGTMWTRSSRREVPAAFLDACADYLAGVDGSPPGPARTALTASLGALLRTPDFDVLLRAGADALEAGGHGADAPAADDTGGERETLLALRLSAAALDARPSSAGAWRLRARALDALGRNAGAVEAYRRFLALSDASAPAVSGAAHRVTVLEEQRRCLARATQMLASGPAADRECPYARAFAAAVRDEESAPRVRAAFTAHLSARMRAAGGADPAVAGLAALHGTYARLTVQGRMPDPLLGGTAPADAGDLRALVDGRRVCVVAGDPRAVVPDTLTDRYDLVVRCDAFRAGAAGRPGGDVRTDVHAVTVAAGAVPEARRHVPVLLRLVFSHDGDAWQQAVRRLVPGAQRYAGDVTLRSPLTDPALLGEDGWGPGTSTAFTVLRLLDFLGTAAAVDLIGHGLPEWLSKEEGAWVRAHAKDAEGMRMSLG